MIGIGRCRRLPSRAGLLPLATIMVAATLPAPARAQSPPPQLLLPLIVSLAMGRTALDAHAAARPPTRPGMRLIPPRFHIPDLYKIEFDRDPPRFAEPVDRDKQASFDLFPRRMWNSMLSISYDTESTKIGEGSDLFRLELEWRW